jgi:ABC-type amino acid transport system permease subunit
MRPIREWRLAWFWLLAGGLAVAATLVETAVCSALGCTLPDWLTTLTDILAVLAALVLYLQAVIWKLRQGQTDQVRTAWRWWLFFLVGGPLVAAVNTGMAVGFYGASARHSFDWKIALVVLASFSVLSGLLFLISLGVRRVLRRRAGVA